MISILKQPQTWQPSYDEVMLTLDSTSKTEESFQFLVNINVDGIFANKLEVSPNIEGFGVVNLGRILESYVSFDIDHATTSTFNQIPNAFVEYDVVLSERYKVIIDYSSVTDNGGFTQYNFPSAHNYSNNTYITITDSTSAPSYNGNQYITSVVSPTSLVTNKAYDVTATGITQLSNGGTTIITGATVMSGTSFVNNMIESWIDNRNFDYTDYIMQTGTTGEFLSSIQDETTVKPNDRFFINAYNHVSNSTKYLKVVTSNGSEYLILNAFNASTDANKFLSIGVGPWNLKNVTSTVTPLSSSVMPIIQSDVTSYTIELTDHLSATTSVQKTINIDSSCSKFINYDFLYFDKKGSLMNFNFDMSSVRTKTFNKTSYIKKTGSYDSVSNTYGSNSWDRGKSHLDIDIGDKYRALSSFVTELEGDRIMDLYESPEVFLLTDEVSTFVLDDGLFWPVISYSDDGGYLQVEITGHPYEVGDIIRLIDSDYSGIDLYVNDVNVNFFTVTTAFVGTGVSGDFAQQKLITTVDSELFGVNVLTRSAEVKQKITKKNINYEIEFEYSNKTSKSQRG